jgi:hypothetical protein
MFGCDICEFETRHEGVYRRHLTTKRHAANVEKHGGAVKSAAAAEEARRKRAEEIMRQHAASRAQERSRAQRSRVQQHYVHAHCDETCKDCGGGANRSDSESESESDMGGGGEAGRAGQNSVDSFVRLIKFALVEQFNMIERQNAVIDGLREELEEQRRITDALARR